MDHPQQGELNWRLSAHPVTLLVFLGFRIGKCALVVSPSARYWRLTAVSWARLPIDVSVWSIVHQKLVCDQRLEFGRFHGPTEIKADGQAQPTDIRI